MFWQQHHKSVEVALEAVMLLKSILGSSLTGEVGCRWCIILTIMHHRWLLPLLLPFYCLLRTPFRVVSVLGVLLLSMSSCKGSLGCILFFLACLFMLLKITMLLWRWLTRLQEEIQHQQHHQRSRRRRRIIRRLHQQVARDHVVCFLQRMMFPSLHSLPTSGGSLLKIMLLQPPRDLHFNCILISLRRIIIMMWEEAVIHGLPCLSRGIIIIFMQRSNSSMRRVVRKDTSSDETPAVITASSSSSMNDMRRLVFKTRWAATNTFSKKEFKPRQKTASSVQCITTCNESQAHRNNNHLLIQETPPFLSKSLESSCVSSHFFRESSSSSSSSRVFLWWRVQLFFLDLKRCIFFSFWPTFFLMMMINIMIMTKMMMTMNTKAIVL